MNGARGSTFHPPPPSLAGVLAAARRLEGVARRTPLEPSPLLTRAAGAPVLLKLETLQRTGSFKLRGAYNALAALPGRVRPLGVVAASAGNHGLGVSLAASLLGLRAAVFVPAGAPEAKKRRIARPCVELHEVEGGWNEAQAAAEAFAAERGAAFVHAFSDPDVVAGQGTVGLEVARALPEVRTLVVPVGGGGLAGGIGIVARALGSGCRVVGVQTEETRGMHASLAAGRVVSPPYGPTWCEGLSGDVDEASLALAREVVHEMIVVGEDAVRRAMRALWVEEGIAAEGSAAVAAAAILEGAVEVEGPAAVVLTGANVDPARLAAAVS